MNATCRDIQDRLSVWLEGELGREESQALRAHVDACPECARELSRLRRLISALHALPDVSPRHDLAPGIMEQVGRGSPPAGLAALFRWRYSLAGVAVTAFLLAGVLTYQNGWLPFGVSAPEELLLTESATPMDSIRPLGYLGRDQDMMDLAISEEVAISEKVGARDSSVRLSRSVGEEGRSEGEAGADEAVGLMKSVDRISYDENGRTPEGLENSKHFEAKVAYRSEEATAVLSDGAATAELSDTTTVLAAVEGLAASTVVEGTASLAESASPIEASSLVVAKVSEDMAPTEYPARGFRRQPDDASEEALPLVSAGYSPLDFSIDDASPTSVRLDERQLALVLTPSPGWGESLDGVKDATPLRAKAPRYDFILSATNPVLAASDVADLLAQSGWENVRIRPARGEDSGYFLDVTVSESEAPELMQVATAWFGPVAGEIWRAHSANGVVEGYFMRGAFRSNTVTMDNDGDGLFDIASKPGGQDAVDGSRAGGDTGPESTAVRGLVAEDDLDGDLDGNLNGDFGSFRRKDAAESADPSIVRIEGGDILKEKREETPVLVDFYGAPASPVPSRDYRTVTMRIWIRSGTPPVAAPPAASGRPISATR